MIECAGKRGRAILWKCLCDCGNTTIVYAANLRRENTKSCGCLRKEHIGNLNRKHDGCHMRIYTAWKNMKSRCYNPNNTDYSRYGGRGITVCDEWKNDFEAFRDWANLHGYNPYAPYGTYTLDRIDIDGNYTPDNCRFVDERVQANNRSTNRYIEFNGRRMNITQWESYTGISQCVISYRLKHGWTTEQALTTPVKKLRRHKNELIQEKSQTNAEVKSTADANPQNK